MTEHGILLDNQISMSLYAQRSTQLALAVGLAALLILMASRTQRSRPGFVVAGLLVGACGIVSAHLLVTAIALGALAWLVERGARRRLWPWFLGPAVAIGLPQLWAILPPTSKMRWLVGWVATERHISWPWMWVLNAGLFLPLFAAAALGGLGARRLRRLSAPLWLWFLAPNLIAFHPWSGNNAKFFTFWQLAGCIVLAALGGEIWAARRRLARGASAAVGALVVVCFAALVATGSVDTLRAMQRSSAIPWAGRGDVQLAEWLRRHASPGDVLVYGATNTSAVAAMSGVPAVSGYPGWTYDLGLADWGTRRDDSMAVLRGGPEADAAIARYGVTWVLIGPYERSQGASDAAWTGRGTLASESGDYRLYRVATP